MHVASYIWSRYEVIQCLCKKELSRLLKRTDVNPNRLDLSGAAPLHSLAVREARMLLKLDLLYTFLVESDVDVDLPDQAGNTVLHLALEVCS